MAYTFATSVEDDLFVARIGGVRRSVPENVEVLREFFSRVSTEMKTLGLRQLLAVIEARGSLRSLDVRTFYRRLGEMGFMADMRLAVVAAAATADRPLLQLAVTAAAQDGWKIGFFWTEEDARVWLSTKPVEADRFAAEGPDSLVGATRPESPRRTLKGR